LASDKLNSFQPSFISRANQPKSGLTYPVPLMMLNWHGTTTTELPEDFVQFAKDVFQKGYKNYLQNKNVNQHLPKLLECPSHFNADAIYAIMYADSAKLASHQDGSLGWVLSVSIGNSCVFSFSQEKDKDVQTIQLDSGDVVLFNGQQVFHAVDKIIPGTAPKFWKTAINNHGFGRFNLQFRDSEVMGGGKRQR